MDTDTGWCWMLLGGKGDQNNSITKMAQPAASNNTERPLEQRSSSCAKRPDEEHRTALEHCATTIQKYQNTWNWGLIQGMTGRGGGSTKDRAVTQQQSQVP